MSRTITMDIFDPASVSAAVAGISAHVTAYSAKVKRKTEELRDLVAQMLRDKSEAGFTGAIASDTFAIRDGKDMLPDGAILANVTVTVDPYSDGKLVIAHGEDAVWVEFGAGVHYNGGPGSVGSYPNPLGSRSDPVMAAIGTYGLGHGAYDAWGYLGGDGKIHITHGTPARMPMYNAIQAIAADLVTIARGVFSS